MDFNTKKDFLFDPTTESLYRGNEDEQMKPVD